MRDAREQSVAEAQDEQLAATKSAKLEAAAKSRNAVEAGVRTGERRG